MYPNRRRLPAPVALQREHRPRQDSAATKTLRPQMLQHITARLLEAKQSTPQRSCTGTTEQGLSRLLEDKRPSRALSIFLCVEPWCTAPRGTASQVLASGVGALVRAASERHSTSLTS